VRRAATPGELRDWERDLSTLDPDCHDGVIRMLSEVLEDCERCDEPIRRCDPRRLVGTQLVHIHCIRGGLEA
jgi:hypothetical protein